jgi:hypothetical protein
MRTLPLTLVCAALLGLSNTAILKPRAKMSQRFGEWLPPLRKAGMNRECPASATSSPKTLFGPPSPWRGGSRWSPSLRRFHPDHCCKQAFALTTWSLCADVFGSVPGGSEVGVRSNSNFMLEALQAVAVGRHRSRQDFDRDRAFEPCVTGAIHFAHAPGTQRRLNFIRAEFGAGGEGHPRAIISLRCARIGLRIDSEWILAYSENCSEISAQARGNRRASETSLIRAGAAHSNCLQKLASCCFRSATSLRSAWTSSSKCASRWLSVGLLAIAGEGALASLTSSMSPENRCM